MVSDNVDDELKAWIWRRDEFTCALCGRTIPWPEVTVIHKKHTKGERSDDRENLLTACAYCVGETKDIDLEEKDKRRLKRLLRELVEYTDHSDIVFEEDYEEEIIKLSAKIEEMNKDYKLLSDAYQEKEKLAIAYKVKMDRALKDLENLKKRIEVDTGLKVRERTKDLFMEMIQVLDNMDRAIQEASKDQNVKQVKDLKKGLISIRKGIMRSLEKNGVEILDPLGDAFDPREHESVSSVKDEERFSDTVVKVQSLGFKLDDLVLRPARVVISRGGPKRKKKERFDDFDMDLGEKIDEMEEMEEMEAPGDIIEIGSGGVDEVEISPRKKKSSQRYR